MGDLRALIKEILAEELASVQAELTRDTITERVSVSTSADLHEFALSVLARANDPGFVSALRIGRLHFEPIRNIETIERVEQIPQAVLRTPAAMRPETLVAMAPPTIPELRKSLVTERDLAAVANGETRLRITKKARLTPLACDEARRRGIRIERTIE